jgi:hypothetical protein
MKASSRNHHEPPGHRHVVTFYPDESTLARTASRFLGIALRQSLPAIIIATPQHQTAITSEFSRCGFDRAQLTAEGNLLIVDSDEFLERVMSGADPIPARFDATADDLIAQACHGRQQCLVYGYGDAVDVLWKRGNPEAAVRLELLWNRARNRADFSLLCAYAVDNFSNQVSTRPDRQAVCDQHDHVVDVDLAV